MNIQDQIIINATVDKVFEVFTDLSKANQRVSAITDIEVLEGSARMEVGTKWKETRKLFGKEASEVMWVTELSKDAGYVVKAQSHGTKYRSEYKFVELPHETTEVQVTFEGKPISTSAKLMSVMAKVFEGATKKALHQDLEDLKKFLEQE